MSTPIAVDARKTMVQVATAHEAFEHLALDRPVDEPGRVEFVAVSAKKLIERTRPRIAWAVVAASWWLRVRAHGRGAPAVWLP